MQKDFDKWNDLKKEIDKITKNPFFRRREIWWCCIGINIGFEEDGKGKDFERPVLILRKLGAHSFIGIPVTTQIKENPIYKSFLLSNGDQRAAIIGQVRVFDSLRLTKYLCTLEPKEFFPIVKAVQNLIEPLTSSSSESYPEAASLEDCSPKSQ